MENRFRINMHIEDRVEINGVWYVREDAINDSLDHLEDEEIDLTFSENKQIMKIELYEVCDQLYLIPTIKTTYSRTLNGFYSIDLVWLKWGLTLMW